jgi:uncharacterized protein Yka (UPF0111/DUF47 family)
MTTVTELASTFVASAENAQRAAEAVAERFATFPDGPITHRMIEDFESTGDQLTASIVHALVGEGGHTEEFTAPGVYQLAIALDDVVDHLDHASELLDLYRVEAPMQQSIEQAAILARAVTGLRTAVEALVTGDGKSVTSALQIIDTCENEGDHAVRYAVAALFEHEHTSPRTIIQWKDIFETLEQAIDAVDHAGHIVGNIALQAQLG